MGLLRRGYEFFLKYSGPISLLAGLATLPFTMPKAREEVLNGNKLSSFLTCAGPGLAVFASVYFGSIVLREFTKDDADDQHTRPGDYKILKDLESLLQKKAPPSVPFNGTKKIPLTLNDLLTLYCNTASGKAEFARETKNPAAGFHAAITLCGKENGYDNAMELVRDSLDWLDGKKADLSFLAWLNFLNYRWAGRVSRKLGVRKIGNYLLSAILESFIRPERAWYYSELGKMVADTFNHPLRKEMYVVHALLASAQHRSDEESAWSDAFRVLQEAPEWQRVGESRSIVRILKNNKFFANTLIFKDSKSHGLLEKGANDYRTLAERVSGVIVPTPLYVSSEPDADGRYTLVMRLLPGKNLLELRKDGKEIPLDAVVEKLAEIHARMPKELPEMKLAYKLRSKLLVKELGISHKQALNIVRNYRPVYNAIKENAVWVYNKDAHLENWLDCNGKLGVIDCEAEYLVPAHYDFANVFGLDDDISSDRLVKYINKYIDKAKVENLPVNPATFVRGVYNSFIDRMLSFSSAWSSPTRPSLHGERKKALSRAVKAIDIIRLVDTEYYESNKSSYDALQLELLNISAKL